MVLVPIWAFAPKTLRLATGHDCTMETAKATGMRTAMTKTFSTGGNQTDADFIVHTAKQLREAVAQAVTVSTAPVTPAARPPAAETLGASTPVARRTLQTA